MGIGDSNIYIFFLGRATLVPKRKLFELFYVEQFSVLVHRQQAVSLVGAAE